MLRGAFLTLLMLCLLSVSACQSSETAARRQVRRELAQRRDASERSMQLYERARKAQRTGKPGDAARFYRDAVQADQDNIYAWLALGDVEFQRKQYYAAAEAFHMASRLAPNRYEPRYNLASVFEATGRYRDAIREYEAALRLSPDQLEVMENLARTYAVSGANSDRARELAERALQQEDRPEWRQWLQLQLLKMPTTTRTTRGE